MADGEASVAEIPRDPVASVHQRWLVLDAVLARLRSTGLIPGMIGIATYLYVIRSPATLTSATLWAEDGTVFFKDAIERGWSQLFVPYVGQVFVFQRTIAAAFAPLPVALQPSLYAAAAIAIAVLSCAIILSSRWRTSAPLGVRFACMVALLCAPGLGETYGTLANVHWWLAVGLLLIGLLRDPLTRPAKVGEVVFAAIVGLSGFAAVYGIPTLVVRLVRNRSRQSLAVLAVALLGLVAQVAFLLGSARRGDLMGIVSDPIVGLLVLAKRVGATAVQGDVNLTTLWPAVWPGAWGWLSVLALVAALALAWRRGPGLEMAALLLALLGGWLLALWALTQPGGSTDWLLWPSAAERFFLVPRAVLPIGIVIAWPTAGRGRLPLGVAASCVLLAGGILSDYHVTQVLGVVDWSSFAQCVEATSGTCTTTIPPGWVLEVAARGR